jgi:[calcium/calmodulin-dependent protein kinase] kinase
MSPEECDPDSATFGAKAIDMWALGVTLFCMLFNRTPFHAETEFALMQAIRTEPVVIPGDDVRQLTSETRELLKSLLEKDCHKRPTAECLVKNAWLMR